jgi:hypothetical protein
LFGVTIVAVDGKTVIFPDVAVGHTLVMTTRREIKRPMFPGQLLLQSGRATVANEFLPSG